MDDAGEEVVEEAEEERAKAKLRAKSKKIGTLIFPRLEAEETPEESSAVDAVDVAAEAGVVTEVASEGATVKHGMTTISCLAAAATTEMTTISHPTVEAK